MKKLLLIVGITVFVLVACVQVPPTHSSISEDDQVATLVAGALSAIPSPLPLSTLTMTPTLTSTPKISADVKWVSTYDANLRITIMYPDTWTLNSSGNGFIRIDAPEKNRDNVPFTIQVSQYNTPIALDQTLLNWTEQYEQNSGHSGEGIAIREGLEINGMDAVYTLLDSPEASFTNYRRGDAVLFVWSNIGKSAGDSYMDIYKQVAASLISD